MLLTSLAHAGVVENLVVDIPFDNPNNPFVDQSGLNNNGQCPAICGISVPGVIGNGIQVIKTDGHKKIKLTNLPIQTTSGAVTTVSFWMYADGPSSYMPFGFGNFDLFISGGNFGFNTAGGDLKGISLVGIEKRWAHVTALFASGNAGASAIYIDGIKQNLVQKKGNTGGRLTTTTAYIAGWGEYYGPEHLSFNGILDEFKMWSRQLTDDDIANLHADELQKKQQHQALLIYDINKDTSINRADIELALPSFVEGTQINGLDVDTLLITGILRNMT